MAEIADSHRGIISVKASTFFVRPRYRRTAHAIFYPVPVGDVVENADKKRGSHDIQWHGIDTGRMDIGEDAIADMDRPSVKTGVPIKRKGAANDPAVDDKSISHLRFTSSGKSPHTPRGTAGPAHGPAAGCITAAIVLLPDESGLLSKF